MLNQHRSQYHCLLTMRKSYDEIRLLFGVLALGGTIQSRGLDTITDSTISYDLRRVAKIGVGAFKSLNALYLTMKLLFSSLA